MVSCSCSASSSLDLKQRIRRVSRIYRGGILLLLALIGGIGCGRKEESSGGKAEPAESAVSLGSYNADRLFTEITTELGLSEQAAPYPDGTFMTPEITPSGVAVFDFDNDGLLDVLHVRHPAPMPWEQQIKANESNRLFRQQAGGRFVEVPGAAGLKGKGYHNGVAVGDVNNDGWQDVYLCNFGGPDEFLLNDGKGGFTDATAAAGFLKGTTAVITSPENWSSTAAFFDYDGDGDLDLWVAHFATFDPKKICKATVNADELDYCGPHTFPGQLATLWRNDGNGTFTDVTAAAGIKSTGRGWGVIAADLTGDGLADVLQANDEEPNQLWVNQGDGTFADEALLRGCALNAFGAVEANMGVAVGDVRRTGSFDVYVTHLGGETNTLWAAQGEGLFSDTTATSGMGAVDRPFTGWGTGFVDFDNDGFLDLAAANGRVARGPVNSQAQLGPFWNRFGEPNLLFRGDGSGRFTDISRKGGSFTKRIEVHRALAFADLRNRGAIDLLSGNLDNTLRVHRNDAVPPGNHWLQVLPMLAKREAIGAKVTITAAGAKRSALCLRAYSYVSSNDPRVHFGLGTAATIDDVEIAWPSGSPKRERFAVNGVDRTVSLRQGEGTAVQ